MRAARITAGDAILRALLRLLPEEFRSGYAREVEATFRTEQRSSAARGLPGLWLWAATAADLLRTAVGEHLAILHRDLRFAVRTMAVQPWHTAVAIGTVALAIGANVAMFAVLDGVLLTPLPYRDPAALVSVAETEQGTDPGNIGYATFVDLRERARSFQELVAAGMSSATLTGGGADAERVHAMRVSRAYFDMLGVPPALGRTFLEEEDRPGAARQVVILSDPLWRRRFGADPGVIGGPIEISGRPYRVVGVMPRGFEDLAAERLYEGAEAWYPLGYDPAASYACRSCRHLRVFGRLAPGVDPEAAGRELGRIFAELEAEHPTEYHASGAEVTRLADVFLGPVRPALLILWAGVGGLLLVACANVANFLLLRASERSHEVAVRAALGVTRGRLARQLLTESVLLALIGGIAALPLSWAALRLIAARGPAQIPRLAEIGMDARALGAALALTVASGVAFGLVPLRQILRRDLTGTMRAGRRITGSRGAWRARAALVALNAAMATLLLVGSGLLVRSLSGLLSVSPGFDPQGVITMRLWASGPAFREGETADQIGTAVRFYDEVLSRVRQLPGVTGASAVTTLPLGGGVEGYGVHIEGRPYANPEEAPSADRFVVTPGFFETMRIPLLRGRLLADGDGQEAEPVAVINRTLARELFPGEDPLGRRISLGPPEATPRRIVGVVDDVRHHGLHLPVGYQVYVPQAQWAWAETTMTLVIRSEGNPAGLARPVREVVQTVDADQPLTNVRLYQEVVDSTLGTRRFATWLLSLFAGAALLLAVAGLYGAVGVMVEQRRREIGVRLALGARGSNILKMVLGQGLRPVALGLIAGLAAALASTGALRSILFAVPEIDPLSFTGAAAVLLAASVLGCLVPAWRGARVDPATTLRAE